MSGREPRLGDLPKEFSPELTQLLRRQDGVATRMQLLRGGVSVEAVRWNQGRVWQVVLPNVFVLSRETVVCERSQRVRRPRVVGQQQGAHTAADEVAREVAPDVSMGGGECDSHAENGSDGCGRILATISGTMVDMAEDADPTARTLRLLAVLGSRPSWSGAELTRRTGSAPRTLRRDIQRLRDLGYHVESRPGPGGHYALRPGARVPPLLFEEDEVAALVAAIRMAQDRVADDALDRALTKLVQVLPRRLGTVAGDVLAGSETVRRDPPDVPLRLLTRLTRAAAEDRSMSFDYRDRHDQTSRRHVDSVRCVWSRDQWYLVAYDLDRADWRVFRMDRVGDLETGSPLPMARPAPAAGLGEWFRSDLGRAPARKGKR